MARFEPFSGVRYRVARPSDVAPLTAPPYDVFGPSEREQFAAQDHRNVVIVDYPLESQGPDRYAEAARTWQRWLAESVVAADSPPSFYIYRMSFTDGHGRQRTTVGVIGALEVAPEGSPQVLPHEQTTPKAKSDRLDLLRSTRVNLSAVWGLLVEAGLTQHLEAPGELVADVVDEGGVRHVLERVFEPARVDAIANCVAHSPVLIADGHHRYAVSRTYRAEQGAPDDGAGLTMTYVADLSPEQLSIEAIHRVLDGGSLDAALNSLSRHYDLLESPWPDRGTLSQMDHEASLRLAAPDGRCWTMREKRGAFAGTVDLDSARVALALSDSGCELSYQHGIDETLKRCVAPTTAVILIRPVSIQAIRTTAQRRELMPPKSTFFTPKLRTGLVFRALDAP